VKRQGVPLLLESTIILEWILLVPLVLLSSLLLLLGIVTRAPGPGFSVILTAFVVLGGMAVLNLFCWRLRPWALWARAGVAFLAATYLFRVGLEMPGFFVLAAERMLQAGVGIWLAYRR